MSYHGKLQTLKNGTADVEIQQWAYQQLEKETVELTDEEILIVWTSSNFVRYTENGHIDEIFFNKFARAILRKAQEK